VELKENKIKQISMYKIIITATLVASILSSCSNEGEGGDGNSLKTSKPVTYTNHIETEDNWSGQVTYKKVPNAHSGDMVSLVDENQPYSITFNQKLINLPDTSAKKMTVSAWIYYPDTLNVKVILAISMNNTAEGKNIAWLGTPVEKIAKIIPNQWVQVTLEYVIPNMKLTGNEEIGACFWNQSKVPIMVDDLEVKFE
jgi:hypothetical protein